MIGTQISRYRILSKIGEGGMGQVYLAQDLHLDRRVALKFLPAGQGADEGARRRLLREANAAARLDHPFITKVYEIGEADAAGSQPFIAMELVEGSTLKERIALGPLPLAEALRISAEIAEALEFARQRGVVHRDLKPANIMLTSDGHAKVMDFGIAKFVALPSGEPGGGDRHDLTATGELAGTPAYMAPEQLKGLPVDSRADIFALGLTLYQMVTGVHPFLKHTSFATADAIVNHPAPPLEQYMREPPELLEHVFRRALAKAPDDRYQSFRDFSIDLSAIARPDTSTAIVSPLRRRPPRQWLVPALVALAVVLGGAVAWRVWPWHVSVSQRALAFNERDWILIADFRNLTTDAVFDRSLRVALDVAIAQSQYVNVFPASRLPETLRLMKKAPSDSLDEALAVEIAVREQIKAVLSCSISNVGDAYVLTAQVIDPQSHTPVDTESVRARGKDAVLPALDELAARIRRNLGESLSSLSKQTLALPRATTPSLEALRLYAESLRAKEDGVAEKLLTEAIQLDPDFAMAHAQLGHTLYISPDTDARKEGEAHLVKALSLLDRLSHRERLWIAALAEDSRGNRSAAVGAYRRYLAEYPDDPTGWYRMGWTYLASLHQYDQAVEAYTKVITLNPSSANGHINLATAYAGLEKYPEAVDHYKLAFDLDPSARTDSLVNHEYGFVLVRLGDFDGATAMFTEMLHGNTGAQARGHRSMALLEMYRGHYGAAIDHLRQSIVIYKTTGAKLSEYRDRLYLTRAYQAKGMTTDAAAELDTAHRLALEAHIAPEWLRRVAKSDARARRVPQARAILAEMERTAGDSTAAASVNRDAGVERAHFGVVQGEIDLVEGRAAEAIERFRAAFVIDAHTDTLESLAAALASAGQLAEAATVYEQLLKRDDLGAEGQEQEQIGHLRLASVYERLGRRDRARQLCEALLAQWKDADPDLIPASDAQALLARLK